MGCFLACFGTSKDRKCRKRANRVLPRDQRNGCYEPLQSTLSLKQDSTEKFISPVLESREKLEEQRSFSTRKKVTFDLNVKTYKDDSTQEIRNFSNNEEKKKAKGEEKSVKQGQTTSVSEDDSIKLSMGSYPLNHRYQNCRNSYDEYDEYEEVESDERDLEDDDEEDDYFGDDDDEFDGRKGEGESSESFFSSPIDSSKRSFATPMAEEVNSPLPLTQELKGFRSNQNARERSQYVHSVLNPVENLTQWKALKVKTAPLLKQQKENFNIDQEPQIPISSEPSFKLPLLEPQKKENDNLEEKSQTSFCLFPKFDHSKPAKQEIAVDASLSNWLGSSETTIGIEGSKSERSNSLRSHDDRPILGALTVEELKQLSASSSPRRSPCRSPDEIPILGTVGRYWSHAEQAMDSSSVSSYKGISNTTRKYREVSVK